MFKKNFIKLCASKNVTATTVCNAVGITISAFSQWTDATVPRQTTLQKIADYFGVTVEYLLRDEKETEAIEVTASAMDDLTEEERKDVLAYIEFVKSKRGK